jgi:two-component system sensor histidine kinase KdpD
MIRNHKQPYQWWAYLVGLGLVAIATLLGHLVQTFFAPTNIIMIYLLCVTVSAVIGGLGPSIMVSVLSVMAFDFFFVPPYLTFEVDDTQYIFTFAALLLVGVTISYLTSRVRHQTETAKLRERETAALYALGRDLAVSGDLQSYISAIVTRMKEALVQQVIIFLPDSGSYGKLISYTGSVTIDIGEKEMSSAERSFRRLEKVENDGERYLPLVTARGVIGVMELKAPESDRPLNV